FFNPNSPTSTATVSVPGVYTFRWTLVNGTCSSLSDVIITYWPTPGITLTSTNISVCGGTISGSLLYSSLIANPDQYSIDYDFIAEGAGFRDVVAAALPQTGAITLVVPGTVPSVTTIYNANLVVKNSLTGCSSAPIAIRVTLNTNPS